MVKTFDKKETDKFVNTVKQVLEEKNVDLLYTLMPTKGELKTLKAPNVDKIYKEQRERIPKSAVIFFQDLEDNKIDTSLLKVDEIDVDLIEYDGIWGTKVFTITFNAGDIKFFVVLKKVVILDTRLVLGGKDITFALKNAKTVTTKKPIIRQEVKKKWTGTYTVETLKNPAGYLEYAHKEATVYDTLHVEGNLDLDNLCDEGIYTLVVKGDLTVTGDIINANSNTGTTLSVEGTTRAKNMIAGGAIISLNNVIIKDFTIGFYNDGILSIEKLSTDILISNDHHTEITNASEVKVYIDYEDDNKGMVNIEDIDALYEYLSSYTELVEVFELLEEYDDEGFYIDYDVLNKMIVANNYDFLKCKIFEFVESTGV